MRWNDDPTDLPSDAPELTLEEPATTRVAARTGYIVRACFSTVPCRVESVTGYWATIRPMGGGASRMVKSGDLIVISTRAPR